MEALVAYADRYAPIANAAGETFNPVAVDVEVVEQARAAEARRVRRAGQRIDHDRRADHRWRRSLARRPLDAPLEPFEWSTARRPRTCAKAPAAVAATPRRSSSDTSSARNSRTRRAWASSRRVPNGDQETLSRRCATPSWEILRTPTDGSPIDDASIDCTPLIGSVALPRPRLGDGRPERIPPSPRRLERLARIRTIHPASEATCSEHASRGASRVSWIPA